jgi:hypothetical protein
MACGRLHNFCIDEDGQHKGNTETILAGIEPRIHSYNPKVSKHPWNKYHEGYAIA